MPLHEPKHERALLSLITGEFEKIQQLDRDQPADDAIYLASVKKITEALRRPKHAGWRTLPDLVNLVRTLYRQEWLYAGGQTREVNILCELLVTFRPGPDGRPAPTRFTCGAIVTSGGRCGAPLPDGRLVCSQHESQGLNSIVPDRDGVRPQLEPAPTAICYGCQRNASEHWRPDRTASCDLCHATLFGECLDFYFENDEELNDPDQCVLCDFCDIHRRPGLLYVTNARSAETGEPCEPQHIPIAPFSRRQQSLLPGIKRRRLASEADETPPRPRQRTGPADSPAGPGSVQADEEPTGGTAAEADSTPPATVTLSAIYDKLRALTALVEKTARRQDILEQQRRDTGVCDQGERETVGRANNPLPNSALRVWGDGPLNPLGITGADALSSRREPQLPAPPRDYARAFTLNPAEFQGRKENQDQAGRVASHPRHIFNKNVVASFDYMGNVADSDAAHFRSHLRFHWSPSDSRPPPRRDLEDYWRQCLDYLWAALHHPDCDVHTELGREREYRILVVVARLKFLKANCDALVDVASERGGGRTSWSDIHGMLAESVKLDFTRPGVLLFDTVFWDQLVTALGQDTRLGTKPHFSDTIQEQLYHNRYREAHRTIPPNPPRAAPPVPDRGSGVKPPAKPTGAPVCGLCLSGAHTFKDHPPNAPITVPCRKCGALHAMSGPLRTPCPSNPDPPEPASRPRNPRFRDTSPDRHRTPPPPPSNR